jgi:lipopolysaccharide/colanic/teichoic acid biosynthesis glycosyltransferase
MAQESTLRDHEVTQLNSHAADSSAADTLTVAAVPRNLTAPRTPTRYERWLKPAIDRIVGLVLWLALLPLTALVAVVVCATLGTPVLYRQRRTGLRGTEFDILKFRTMLPDRRRCQVPFEGSERRRTHKSAADPRHTRVGRFLRASSLDELPQLWNVVRGDLSLVGPRPELIEIVARYEPWQHARHMVKPGVTGLWQVTKRGDGDMHQHVDVDLRYVEAVSLRTDLRILVLTLPAVLGLRRGA